MFYKDIRREDYVIGSNVTLGRIIAANQYFDQSMLITSRILLADRCETNFFIGVEECMSMRGSRMDTMYERELRHFNLERQGITIVHLLRARNNSFDKDFGDALDDFTKHQPKFVAVTGANAYLKQHGFGARVFINTEDNSAVVFESKDIGLWHLLQSLIPVLVPNFFKDKPLTEWEKELLNSLTLKDSAKYESLVDEYIKEHDYRAAYIKSSLSNFEDEFESKDIENLMAGITNISDRVSTLEKEIDRLLREQEQKYTQLRALSSKKRERGNTESELIQFLTTNKAVRFIKSRGTEITVEIATYLSNFNRDLMEDYLDNKNSFLYGYDTDTLYNDFETEDAIALLRAIFIDETVRVKLRGRFMVDFSNEINATQIRGYRDFSTELRDYADNPHITHYFCLGNNERELRRAIRERDYVATFTSLISIVSNLNTSEIMNVKNFISDLFYNPFNVVELPDGTSTTVYESIKWLKGEANE